MALIEARPGRTVGLPMGNDPGGRTKQHQSETILRARYGRLLSLNQYKKPAQQESSGKEGGCRTKGLEEKQSPCHRAKKRSEKQRAVVNGRGHPRDA